MSAFIERLESDLKTAMRSRDSEKVSTLRMLMADLKNAGIEKKGREELTEEVSSPAAYLSESECVKVLQSALKKRRESAEQYHSGNRPELAAKEEAEAVVIQEYLPKGLDEAELEALVRAAIAECGAQSPAEMGAVMKAVMPKVAGRADGKAVSATVKKLLS